MASVHQIHANQLNAQNSTGPKSLEGRKRSSLNAVRHGFTGQVLVLPESEVPHYQLLCNNYHHDFAPKGQLETDLVQEMADLRWSLNRIRAHETSLLSLEAVSCNLPVDTGDPEINSTLAVADSLRRNIQALATLSLYEQRKLRAFEKTRVTLAELQKARLDREFWDLDKAAEHRRVFLKTEPEWIPATDGFVCSESELDRYVTREWRKNFVRDALAARSTGA